MGPHLAALWENTITEYPKPTFKALRWAFWHLSVGISQTRVQWIEFEMLSSPQKSIALKRKARVKHTLGNSSSQKWRLIPMADLIVLVPCFDGWPQVPTRPSMTWRISRSGRLPTSSVHPCTHTHTNVNCKWSLYTFFNTQLKYYLAFDSFSRQYTTTTEISTTSFLSSLCATHNYLIISIITYYIHLFTCVFPFTILWTLLG